VGVNLPNSFLNRRPFGFRGSFTSRRVAGGTCLPARDLQGILPFWLLLRWCDCDLVHCSQIVTWLPQADAG